MDQARKLISHILSSPATCESDGTPYELLKQYQSGSPIDSLRELIYSPDDRVAGEAAWIASELSNGTPLLRDIGVLLRHRSKSARFWAIDCVHLWAGPHDGYELAAAAALIDDIESAVRWKAMVFLALASLEQLNAALDKLRSLEREPPYLDALAWLISSESKVADQIIAMLDGPDYRRRKVGAVAAFRIASGDPAPLHHAAAIDDQEVAHSPEICWIV